MLNVSYTVLVDFKSKWSLSFYNWFNLKQRVLRKIWKSIIDISFIVCLNFLLQVSVYSLKFHKRFQVKWIFFNGFFYWKLERIMTVSLRFARSNQKLNQKKITKTINIVTLFLDQLFCHKVKLIEIVNWWSSVKQK